MTQKILIIDDDQSIRESVSELLISEGHEVVTAANGLDGLDLLKKNKIKLVIVDLRMPIMDGWEFKQSLDADPSYKELPVFVFSATPDYRPPGITATGFITKPVDIEELLRMLAPYLKH